MVSAALEGAVADIVRTVRTEGREVLLESESLSLAAALGFSIPHHVTVEGPAQSSLIDFDAFAGDRVVVKALSPEILHKTEAGAVAVVEATEHAVRACMESMRTRLGAQRLAGFLIVEFVRYSTALGGELLLGLRWTDAFGPVVTLGPGGTASEYLAAHLDDGRSVTVVAPGLPHSEHLSDRLRATTIGQLATGVVRGMLAHTDPDGLTEVVRRCLALAECRSAPDLAEFEINPLVWTSAGPTALDALGRLRTDTGSVAPPRPLRKLEALLRPRTMAIMGVSEQDNPGRIILRNTLREGFPAERLRIVKPGATAIDGVRCVSSLEALDAGVDLLVVSVSADQAPAILDQVITHELAESVIVIPGGFGERSGTEQRAAEVRRALHVTRSSRWGGPVVNGGNCLGVRSVPGRYDTTFIPDYKLPPRDAEVSPTAVISQSGALAVALSSKLGGLNPRFVVSVGNQMDLTVGDYLTHLMEDPEIEVFACYVEGFAPLDGRRFLDAAAAITAAGRRVILYQAGRSPAGARAMVSHTAAVATDSTVARSLAGAAGVVVADTLDDFADLTRLFTMLGTTHPQGWRLGAVSNAGFECVAIADALGPFTLAQFGRPTARVIRDVLAAHRLDEVVAVQNPLDLTPIVGDAGYERVVRAILEDDGVDVAVVGCVPLTGALQTLPAGDGYTEDVRAADSVIRRLGQLRRTVPKPWVAVVDAGAAYDVAAALLEASGVPTFRTADRALKLMGRFCRSTLELTTRKLTR